MSDEPAIEQIIRIGRSLGITLGAEEAEVFQERARSKLGAIEQFMAEAMETERPPLLFPEREPGHRPTRDEDRFNAWLWKCEVRGEPSGLLAGKTVSFKDHVAVAGIPLTLGSLSMPDLAPDFDATIVTRVLASGGTIVGKNSMNGPTSAWGSGVPSDFLRPMNPHAPDHLTGGSSSGCAAAVAGREVDIAFGGDQGGSIRIPAAFCGVYGLKPTFGLISHFGIGFGSEQSFDHTGPMARYVEDVAAALDAVAGYDGLDPRQDRSVPSRMDTRSVLMAGIRGLRIGVLREGFIDAVPEVRDAVNAAVGVLVAAGAEATNISIPEHVLADRIHDLMEIEGQRAAFDVGFFGAFAKTYYPADYLAATYSLYHERTDRLKTKQKLTLILSELVRRRWRGGLYAKAQNVRATIRRAFDSAFTRVDVLAMPTCLDVAAPYVEPHESLPSVAFEPQGAGGLPRTRSTSPFNYTGHPALSVPCGKSRGLPIGMQLVGRYYDEALLFRAAYAFQHSVDWNGLIATPDSVGVPAVPSAR